MVVVAVYDVVVAVDCMSCSCFSLVVYRVVVVVVVFVVVVFVVGVFVVGVRAAFVVACVVTFVARNQVEACVAFVVAFVVAFAVRIQHLAPTSETSVAFPFVDMTSLRCVLVWQHFVNGVNGVMLNSLVILSVALI